MSVRLGRQRDGWAEEQQGLGKPNVRSDSSIAVHWTKHQGDCISR